MRDAVEPEESVSCGDRLVKSLRFADDQAMVAIMRMDCKV